MTKAAKIALLQWAIERSGLSAQRYAREVLLRNVRTVQRWLAGDSPIPREVVTFLQRGQAKEAS